MSDPYESEISKAQQPKSKDYDFDLERVLSSVVLVRAQVPPDAYTASRMGTDRAGHGVLIGDDGLIATIGYLITEADVIWIVDANDRAVPGHVVGYDQETGFGLVQALQPLDLAPIELGESGVLKEGDAVIVAGYGGRAHSLNARVISKREFAGYWEYLLEEGIFTAPPHPNWGGAAMIGKDGKLLGVGSLFVQQVLLADAPVDGNMFIPIDLIKPVMEDLLRYGTNRKPPRPWLGITTAEAEDKLVIARLNRGGPARGSGLQVGDFVVAINGRTVDGLADMYRKIWSVGEAGVDVPMTVLRDGDALEIKVKSGNRSDRHRQPRLH
jgi:S1-C subfamily serine protease